MKTEIINLRVEPRLKDKLSELAIKDKRSLNSYCEIVLEKHLEQIEKEQEGEV